MDQRRRIGRWASTLYVALFLALALALLRPSGDAGTRLGVAALLAIGGYAAWRLARIAETAVQNSLQSTVERDRARLESDRQRSAIDAFADGLDVAIIICDETARVAYANRTAQEMFGASEPVGRPLLAMTLSPEIEAMVDEASREGTAEREVLFHRPGDRTALAKAWVPAEGNGRTFLSLIEISDLRRLERVRRDFVANVSHELRTPMTIIRAYAETLLDDDDATLKDRYMGKIIAEVDRLTSISHDLLVLSTAESGTVDKGVCDLAEIVRGATSGLQIAAAEKALDVRYDGPDSLVIAADSEQMTQVALNLVENAVKYSREGTVLVRLQRLGPDVQLCVSDTGIGIGSEHVERIFERFYRVDKGRTRRDGGVGGTGLGLAIVKHIVEAHGGTVLVDSVLNAGSTFCVSLPVGDVTALPESEEPG